MEKLRKMLWNEFEIDIGDKLNFEYDVDTFFNSYNVPQEYRTTLYLFFLSLSNVYLYYSDDKERKERIDKILSIFRPEIQFLNSLVETN